jgi:UDP-N-acetylglucosamine 2-epimerase (non-hydrolysing)
MKRKRLAFILGIRPDVIRASLILKKLRADTECDLRFIWSGQHYSDNLKDIFFRELQVAAPDIELGAAGANDAEISASVIARLYPVLESLQPDAAVFLGDTNTVVGCLAAAQLNIPIVHIEGCMRSYDWRMPEEKYRSTIDHLSDVIYTYLPEYKQQGVAEGLNPDSIVVVGNPIVDVLNEYYFARQDHFACLASEQFFAARGIARDSYYLMTCHRRENVHQRESLGRILQLVSAADSTVYFPASYRTQKLLREFGLSLPSNLVITDPVGYEEFLVLMTRSRGILTDSGTVVEEACVLQIPCVQMRKSTERPQVYAVGAAVKFDPNLPEAYPIKAVLRKLTALQGKQWPNPFGDGRSSERIAEDLLRRLREDAFARHRPDCYHLDIAGSYREDGLIVVSRKPSNSPA